MKAPQADSKLKFVYWFAHYNLQSPSVRYRGKYPLDFLKANYGIGSYFVMPGYSFGAILRFVRAYFSALFFIKSGSLIVIQRVNSNFIYANLLRLLVKIRKDNIIYDLDDADFLEYPPKSIWWFIKNCSSIVVGSNELLRNLSTFNKSVFLNTSPTPDLNIIKKNKNPILTVGWVGCFGGDHKESLLNLFFPALHNLPFKIKLVLLSVTTKSEIKFLAEYFSDFKNVSLEMPQNINWMDERSLQERIAMFDIGIATLLDNELQRSKSAFKTKQYLNNGVPVLSSDIPENNLFVEHGKNGFLCSSPADFRQRLIEIHEMDQANYSLLSTAARETICNFNLANYCNGLIAVFEKTILEENLA
jgi:glycosyltransferase involved in cell wall biosynthesis